MYSYSPDHSNSLKWDHLFFCYLVLAHILGLLSFPLQDSFMTLNLPRQLSPGVYVTFKEVENDPTCVLSTGMQMFPLRAQTKPCLWKYLPGHTQLLYLQRSCVLWIMSKLCCTDYGKPWDLTSTPLVTLPLVPSCASAPAMFDVAVPFPGHLMSFHTLNCNSHSSPALDNIHTHYDELVILCLFT